MHEVRLRRLPPVRGGDRGRRRRLRSMPPGGVEGVARLAKLLGKPVIALNPEHGVERPRPVAFIDEQLCIGCTLCMQACPVDAIVGAPKQMHTIVAELCTGCDLCVPPCPVDCIAMIPVTGEKTGWDAWSQQQADAARAARRAPRAPEARARSRRSACGGASRGGSGERLRGRAGCRCVRCRHVRRPRSGSEEACDHCGGARTRPQEEGRARRPRRGTEEHRRRERRRAGADRRGRSAAPAPRRTARHDRPARRRRIERRGRRVADLENEAITA